MTGDSDWRNQTDLIALLRSAFRSIELFVVEIESVWLSLVDEFSTDLMSVCKMANRFRVGQHLEDNILSEVRRLAGNDKDSWTHVGEHTEQISANRPLNVREIAQNSVTLILTTS